MVKARDRAHHALSSAASRSEPGLWMKACAFLGGLKLRGGAPAEALPFFKELERLAGLTGSRQERIIALQGQGDALRCQRGGRDDALRILEMAMAEAAQHGGPCLQQSVLGSLIELLRVIPDQPRARRLVLERKRLILETDDRFAPAQTELQHGHLCRDCGERDDARVRYTNALAMARDTGDSPLAEECERALWSLGD